MYQLELLYDFCFIEILGVIMGILSTIQMHEEKHYLEV